MKEITLYKCKFCNKIFLKESKKHKCLNNKYNKNTNVSEVKGYINDFGRISEDKISFEIAEEKRRNGNIRKSKEFLEYIKKKFEEGYSANRISKFCKEKFKIKCNAARVIKVMKDNNLKTLTINEANNLPEVINNRKKTCFLKYGVFNPSQSEKIKEKKKNTFLLHYGIDNIFRDTEYIKKCMLKKQKVEHSSEIQRPESYFRNKGLISYAHQKVIKLLNTLNIQHKVEQVLLNAKKYNVYLKREHCPRVDILLNNNKIIEIYGNLWHANPRFYKKDDLIYTWKGWKKAEEIWEKDKARINQILSCGYKILIIWEEELCHTEKLIQKILKFAE